MLGLLWIKEGTNPWEKVAGLTLLDRNIKTLMHWGAQEVRLVSSVPLDGDTQGLQVVSPDTLSSLSEPTLVAYAHVVQDKGLKELLETPTCLQRNKTSWMVAHLEAGCDLSDVTDPETLHRVSKQPAQDVASHFYHVEVLDRRSARKAANALWNSCRKPMDGLVAKYINRNISLQVSRALVNTSITPNHVTIFCIFLGLAAAWFASMGTYASILVGAFLLKSGSVLDGVDGELARVKWQYSKIGELLDSVGDNIANFSFFGALTWSMHQAGHTTYAWLGVACLIMWASYVAFLYVQLYAMGRGDVLLVRQNIDEVATGWLARFIHILRTVILRRDGYVMFILVMALLGWHGLMMLVMCLGAAIPFLGVLIHYALAAVSRLRG